MSGAIPWKLLQRQYFSDSVYEDELIHHIESPEAVSCRIENLGSDFMHES